MLQNKRPLVAIIRNASSFDFGGGERFPVFLAKTLQKETPLDAIVISRHAKLLDFAASNDVPHKKGWWWAQQNWSGWRVIGVPIYMLWQLALFVWYLQLFLRLRPAVVHPQGKDDFIAATFAGRVVGAKVVWSDYADLKHVWLNVRRPFKNPVGKLVYLSAHLADAIAVVSDTDHELVAQNLAADSRVRKKLVTVHNGVYDRFANYPTKEPSKEVVYVCASRLVYDKGIKELITAFKKLHAEHANTRLVLLGDGPDRPDFEAMITPADAIELKGHVNDPLADIAQADIFVHPTYHEGFSIALLEASMMQKAIIATNVGGNPELVHDGQTGLLVPVKNVDGLYAGMQKLYTDQPLREKLAAQARDAFVQNLTLEKVVANKFVPLYASND